MKITLCIIAALSLGLGARLLTAQELEPGVQTSTAAAPVSSKAPAQAAAASANSPSAKPKAAPPPAAPPPAALPPAAPPPAASTPLKGKSTDRIELDTTQISGNRELPKVMYVVPWRRAEPGDFSGKPPNSLLDEALTPVDRDVFRRQNRYYSAVQDQAQSAKSQAGAASEGSDGSTHKDEK